MLRRQVKRDFKKPLVIMSPKSLLRHPSAQSKIEEFVSGSFQEILDDPIHSAKPTAVKRVVLCSGKVYYDLVDYRTKNNISDTAVVRIEQLYPLKSDRLAEIAKQYKGARIVWAQEESQNMGAWSWISPQLQTLFGSAPVYAGRDASSSPAVGILALHRIELENLLKDAFNL